MLILNGDSMFVTAGGNMVKIWDITNGGKMLRSLSPHHKLVTSMCLADNGQSLVTGSLDRQVIFTWIISSAATPVSCSLYSLLF